METKGFHVNTKEHRMVSKTIIEVAITVETTNTIIIMEEATTDLLAQDQNSTHRSSKLSFAVTLCNKELALSLIHASSHTENMS